MWVFIRDTQAGGAPREAELFLGSVVAAAAPTAIWGSRAGETGVC